MVIAELLRKRYGLSVRSEARAGGSKAQASFISTDRGSFYMRTYEPEEIEHRRAVDDLLRTVELPFAVPLVIAAIDGERFIAYDDAFYAVFEQLPGLHAHPTPDASFELGSALARLHGALPRAHLPAVWRDALSSLDLPDREASMLAELRDRFAERIRAVPRGIVHADFIFENTLFEAGRVRSVLDFDTLREDALVRDLAISLAIEGYDAEAEPNERYERILAGYESIRPLSPEERVLMDPLIVDAALDGWLWERATAPEKPARAARYLRIVERTFAGIQRSS